MARRYARDNRGRFASSGGGATARGGRLRTAAGNKRQTQTMKASAAPKGTIGKPRGLKPGAIARDTKPRLKRTGQTIKVARVKPPKPTKEDRAIEKVASLKAATKIGGRAKLTFVPDSSLTPARRKSLGLSAFAIESGSQRYRVSRQTFGNERGVAISERSSYQARLPKTRQGVVRDNSIAFKRNIREATTRINEKRAARAATAKPAAKAVAKVNLSQTAFERRAKITEKRARAAEKAVAGVDRAYTANRRAFRTADALRSAADSYASYARRGKNNPDFTAADLFKGRARRSTAPKLSKSEKAAATRRANADQRFRDNVRRMEADRRRR